MFEEEVSVWVPSRVSGLPDESRSVFAEHLDKLGLESGVAQELNGPITSAEKLQREESHVLLLSCKDGVPNGFIKYGEKNLFFYSEKGVLKEVKCICVLDFYVSTQLQRSGIGSLLFNNMLKRLDMPPHALAYDRPSPKLVSFLAKHHQLVNPDLQPNRYAIFPDVFLDGVLNDKGKR
jgi:alpha-tubulin N-acetyltransferase 1